MAGRHIASVVMTLSIVAAPASAQSLGELARKEEARRAITPKAAMTLSNADLKPGEVSSPASPTSPASPASPDSPASSADCYMSIRLGGCATADEVVANSIPSKVRGDAALEQKWRQDAESIRSQVEGTRRQIATLERVIADGSASDSEAAGQALVSAQRALAGFERQWIKLERAAGNQRIPRAWLEPIPTLTTRQ